MSGHKYKTGTTREREESIESMNNVLTGFESFWLAPMSGATSVPLMV